MIYLIYSLFFFCGLFLKEILSTKNKDPLTPTFYGLTLFFIIILHIFLIPILWGKI